MVRVVVEDVRIMVVSDDHFLVEGAAGAAAVLL